jgi:hypothetical protein
MERIAPAGEQVEFARAMLLTHYEQNPAFMLNLRQFSDAYSPFLSLIASQPAAHVFDTAADPDALWALASVLAVRLPHPSAVAAGYMSELREFAEHWGLRAEWCRRYLNAALATPRIFAGVEADVDSTSLVPWFETLRDLSGVSLLTAKAAEPALLVRQNAPGRGVDLTVWKEGEQRVSYDPRWQEWRAVLAEVRWRTGRKRLPRAVAEQLEEARTRVIGDFLERGYVPRLAERTVQGEHTLRRRTRWAYLAICPPRRTTSEILEITGSPGLNTQAVDRGIVSVLDLLGLPRRTALR